VFYVAVAIGFGIAFAVQAGGEYAAQYFAGYLVEKSLSVDNPFVFVIMTTFAVPEASQQEALTSGIITALVMRAIFIVVGRGATDSVSRLFSEFLGRY